MVTIQSEQKAYSGLRPWQPGQSGNPGGRPKDKGITSVQIEMLDKVCPVDTEGRTWREFLAFKGLILAAKMPQAAESLKDRIEGRVPSRLELDAHIMVATPDQLLEANRRMVEVIEAQEVKLLAEYIEEDNAAKQS